MKRLAIFDFDATLVFTPEPEEGKKKWSDHRGISYPHAGWWSKPESLDMEVFYMALNQWTYNQYLKHSSDNSTYVVLATGRMEKLRREVQSILNLHDLEFDEIHLNPGKSTFSFKRDLFDSLISKISPKEVFIYDDRQSHLKDFYLWASGKPLPISIYDVTKSNKTPISNY